jgi:hypothetical protein
MGAQQKLKKLKHLIRLVKNTTGFPVEEGTKLKCQQTAALLARTKIVVDERGQANLCRTNTCSRKDLARNKKSTRQISTGSRERKSLEERSTGRHPLTHEKAVGKATSGAGWEERSRP